MEVHSVTQAKIVDPLTKVGYVRLDGFQKTSTEELKQAIADLDRQGMRFLVLDLRGNPGGLLDVAVEMADEFLEGGVIVSTRGRAARPERGLSGQAGGVWKMPMVVLIDHDSASASEILAGALKDNGRATCWASRATGRARFRASSPLRSAPAGLKLTTAKFYSPRNLPYNEQGSSPTSASGSRPGRRERGKGRTPRR